MYGSCWLGVVLHLALFFFFFWLVCSSKGDKTAIGNIMCLCFYG